MMITIPTITEFATSGVIISLLIWVIKQLWGMKGEIAKNAQLICFLMGFLELIPDEIIAMGNPRPEVIPDKVYQYCLKMVSAFKNGKECLLDS